MLQGTPDHFSWKRGHKYFDAKSKKDAPTWFMVDIKLDEIFAKPLPLALLKEQAPLAEMMLVQKGSRLSVQPVTKKEWDAVHRLAKKLAKD